MSRSLIVPWRSQTKFIYVPLSMPRAWHSLSYRRETLPQFNKERCTESFHGHFSFLLFYRRKMSLAISSKNSFRQPSGFPFSSGAVWRRRRRRRNLFSSSVRRGLRSKKTSQAEAANKVQSRLMTNIF